MYSHVNTTFKTDSHLLSVAVMLWLLQKYKLLKERERERKGKINVLYFSFFVLSKSLTRQTSLLKRDHWNKSTPRSGVKAYKASIATLTPEHRSTKAHSRPSRCEPRVIIFLTLTRRSLPITKCAVTSPHFEPWHEQGTC